MLAINRYHVRLLVEEFKDCFLFYADMLELPVRYGDQEADYAEFKTDTVHVALFRKGLMQQALGTIAQSVSSETGGSMAIVLRVDDVDQSYSYLRAKGIEFDTIPEDRIEWNCRTAHFRDPDGNLLELNGDLK